MTTDTFLHSSANYCNLNYETEDDLDNTAKNGIPTVSFIDLLECPNRPHKSKWVRSVNLQFECALEIRQVPYCIC